jgi:hypothetical protein
MTTLHAILYITEAGRQWLRNAHVLSVNNKIRFDLATAQLMPTIKAYGLNSPIWYQRDLICPRGANKIDRCHIANDFLNNSKRVFPSKKTLEDEIKKYLLDTEYTFSAKALCQKWLDGLTPLIDTEHEKVLTELLEVLKKLV